MNSLHFPGNEKSLIMVIIAMNAKGSSASFGFRPTDGNPARFLLIRCRAKIIVRHDVATNISKSFC